MKRSFCIAIHGGAGTIRQRDMTVEKETALRNTLMLSIKAGMLILENGGEALDATISAVRVMEDSPLFNAGKGSVFNSDGQIEMDASVMCGKSLKAGAVTCVRTVKNPVLLAKAVMEHSQHVLLSGSGAEVFARSHNLQFESESYFFTQFRSDQLKLAKQKKQIRLDHQASINGEKGTVGAVALDQKGNLAAATSTGGMTNQLPGRIGDTPLIGCGTYADNKTCAVSCTGTGESFIRGVSAYDVSALMAYKDIGLQEAAEMVIRKNKASFEGEGGLIAVDCSGNLALPFNSEGMYRAWCYGGEQVEIRFYRE